MSPPLSKSLEHKQTIKSFEAAFHFFRGQGDVRFFTNPSNRMLQTFDQSNDWITTADVLRAHVQRVILVVSFYLYGLIHPLWDRVNDVYTIAITCIVVEWAQTEGILATLLFPVDVVSRITALMSTVSLESRSIIPRDKPTIVGLVWRLNDLPLEIPISTEEGCSRKEAQRCSVRKNEYLTKTKVHYAAEEVRLLHELALFCHWNHNSGINTVVFHEENGLLWSNDDPSDKIDFPLWVQRIKEAIEVEISTSPSLQTISHVEIIDLFALRSFKFLMPESSTNLGDTFVIYLSDSRVLERPIDESSLEPDLAKFPPSPELLLNLDRFATNFCTSRFLPTLFTPFHNDEGHSIVCYRNLLFGYCSYVKGLHYFMRAKRFTL